MADTPFTDALAQWQAWCEAPWGRLRFTVVEETLRRQTVELGGDATPLRVLDVGGGDGRDALPLARAGHHVTIVDPEAAWLEEAQRRADRAGVVDRIETRVGSVADLSEVGRDFDLVLCHFVLHYRPEDAGDVDRLADRLRPGGRLSVMAPNPDARVVMRLTREGPAAALEELESDELSSRTFDTTARKITAEQAVAELERAGLRTVGRYAARVANDYVSDDSLKHDPAYFADLERLELALCDREPFLRLGGVWQVVAAR